MERYRETLALFPMSAPPEQPERDWSFQLGVLTRRVDDFEERYERDREENRERERDMKEWIAAKFGKVEALVAAGNGWVKFFRAAFIVMGAAFGIAVGVGAGIGVIVARAVGG